jgi:hypothetical protein
MAVFSNGQIELGERIIKDEKLEIG